MSDVNSEHTVKKLLRQQAALAAFGSFAFRESDLLLVLSEATRICAACLEVPFAKVCRYRAAQDDLLIVAGWGWQLGVVGRVISQADESSPQGRAYVTGRPVITRDLHAAAGRAPPAFYAEHGVVSTVDVVIPAIDGTAFGVLEVDSTRQHRFDAHDINFLTGFANVLAESVAAAARVKALRDALAARDLLAEELQHRVRNNLQMIISMLEGYARTVPDDEARQGVDLIVRRVVTLAQVYDSLLGVGLSETVDLADYLRMLCASLPGLQAERTRPVRILCQAEPVMLGLDEVTALGMAVAELVTNSYGHAFPDREGTITVTLVRTSPAAAMLTLQDDGVGFTAKVGSSRHGLGLVRRLVERVGGTLDTRSGKGTGTTWTLGFPLPQASDRARAAA